MDLPVYIDPELYSCKLPHKFLDHLLAEGYDFQGPLCLKVSSPFNHVYTGILEFKGLDQECSIDIGLILNQYTNLITGDYVHVEVVDQPESPLDIIVIQGHYNSFGDVKDVKEKLENMLSSIRVLNKDMELMLDSDPNYRFSVVKLLNDKGQETEWGITVGTELRVDFIPTRETEELQKKEQEMRELEKRGFYGEGKCVGAGAGAGASIRDRRQSWLDKLQGKI